MLHNTGYVYHVHAGHGYPLVNQDLSTYNAYMSLKVTHTLAKEDDGGIQITFTIPKEIVAEAKQKALAEIGQTLEIAGFRKGNAPISKVEEKADPGLVLEKTLQSILPKALGKAIDEYKLKLAVYPKFEALKIKDGEDWQIKAISCEIPMITLGDYKKTVVGTLRTKSIWTPDKAKDQMDKSHIPSREEVEQTVISTLIKNIKVTVPKILINEEVNVRLSQLLERLEKLGLTLESYLSSVKKTGEELRKEYEVQAQNSISLELILEEVAREEKISVTDTQIDEAIKAASVADSKMVNELNTPEKRRLLSSVLRKRAAIDLLASLV